VGISASVSIAGEVYGLAGMGCESTNAGDHPVAAKKLRFNFTLDRRLGRIAWFK
jgi:hypothetical protein